MITFISSPLPSQLEQRSSCFQKVEVKFWSIFFFLFNNSKNLLSEWRGGSCLCWSCLWGLSFRRCLCLTVWIPGLITNTACWAAAVSFCDVWRNIHIAVLWLSHQAVSLLPASGVCVNSICPAAWVGGTVPDAGGLVGFRLQELRLVPPPRSFVWTLCSQNWPAWGLPEYLVCN